MAPRTQSKNDYHASNDNRLIELFHNMAYKQESEFTYTFENFFHPFVGELIEKLNKDSLPGLFDPQFLEELGDVTKTPSSNLPGSYYTPNPSSSKRVKAEFHDKEIDIKPGGPYANYNWELFFHIPLTIAVHLSKNQRFAEAQRWFHFIFDPTANDTSIAVPQRYWNFIAFRKNSAGKQIDELLALLSKPDSELIDDEPDLKATILEGYEAIKNKPFQPHAVARTRHLAYMYSVVMKYLDNLIAWGDQLFRQDTLESINEATQIYVLATNILGKRPERVPLKGKVKPKTFAQLQAQGLDPMGNALVELEGLFPFNHGIPTGSDDADAAAPLFGIGRTLYFCVPRNDKLLGYWDTVADRLFKIRHCMNIEGVVRPLALFDPPLDPGMLVKAAAAGIDIGAIVAGLNQPVSPVRAQLLIQKALELCAEVRNLGSALLSAIEKGDDERMALLRQGHEIEIQQLQQEVRFLQWKQAQEGTESLLKTRAVILERYQYYLRLLGQAPDGNLAPDIFSLDRRELTEESFDEAYAALVGQYAKDVPVQAYPQLSMEGGASPLGTLGEQGPGKLFLTTSESDEIEHLISARNLGLAASIFEALVPSVTPIPDAKVDLHYWGIGGTVDMRVGTAITMGIQTVAKILQMTAAWDRDQAGIASRTATYERRVDDWTLQANSAAHELRQIGRQVISSLIAEQIAHREYRNVLQQIEHAQEMDRFLREKFTNAELYAWMQGELSRLYYEYYRFAFDVAHRSEQTMKRELMRPELDNKTLVKFNYWEGGRKGLLSGEALYLDVKRMEMAYHEQNQRELELTKHVSMLQVDPLALVQLRTTGRCTLRLPESLFDMDGPGHYFRRIKTVAVSIPCVTGPYASVNCTLTLLKSSIRKTAVVGDQYARIDANDERYSDYFGSLQSIVTSSAQNDSGLFETNLRDERYLPFENSGAISEWQLQLPADPSKEEPAQFDYSTVSDVILHVRYTARDGGRLLRNGALAHLDELITESQAAGSVRLFSVRHEFPSEWSRFTTQAVVPNQRFELTLPLRDEHYPFWSRGRLETVTRVDILARPGVSEPPNSLEVAEGAGNGAGVQSDPLVKNTAFGNLFVGRLQNVPLPAQPTGDLPLFFNSNALLDVWIVVTWGA
ncbi:hypothetical protein KG088_17645 [Halomonas sp. TRM85114]|uniref:Tc toxin subunit A-related protein n=1 Tax=Halomonas jincaotanensis TaxID=2810616 RepID=UPI001BD28981|nr:hypothetical protein [Halomonas jincaotanensis]MBS9405434.1 hypothetical protein [Halomonas jincaotanensis]